MANRRVILASQSPRRQELLKQAGIDFIVDASSIDEVLDESLELEERLKQLAIDKGQPIALKYPSDVVISADTTVYYDGEVIGKPVDENQARAYLEAFSGHVHDVFTSVAIFFDGKCLAFVDDTKVTFKKIDDLLDDYLASKEWDGKAGAYGIQGKAGAFVEAIDGDYDNVVGLPVKHVIEVLKANQLI